MMNGETTKRVFDILVVIGAAPVWLPLTLVLAILVRWKLGSPVLFRQNRPGRGERIFVILKFRTMIDACDSGGRLLPDQHRLTPFGLWLRSTSLDELPELVNVLRGDMSLVGPRPLLVRYLPRYSSSQRRRHEVLPGLTGWSQVNGRNALTWDEKFALDLWYVEHRNFWLDLKILFLTARSVFMRTGVTAPGEATMPEFQPPASASGEPARTPPLDE